MDTILGFDNCPNCGTEVGTPAEAAAHVCPNEAASTQNRDATALEIVQAEQQTKLNAAKRAAIIPTPAALKADARKLVQAVIDGWDQDVECVVALVPKGSGNITFAAFTTDDERQRFILKTLLQRRREEVRKL